MRALADRLEESELMASAMHPTKRRAKVLVLTEPGEQVSSARVHRLSGSPRCSVGFRREQRRSQLHAVGPKIPAYCSRSSAESRADFRERLAGQIHISGPSDLSVIETLAAQTRTRPAQMPHHRVPMKSDLATDVTRRRTCLVELDHPRDQFRGDRGLNPPN